MNPVLLHIYGPFSIQAYGVIIALGLIFTAYLCQRNPLRARLMSYDQMTQAIVVLALSAIFGGRLLFVIEEWDNLDNFYEIISFWQGGLSILGAIIAALVVQPIYLFCKGISVIRFYDLIFLYAPLLQAIGRVGCFVAGCCWGSVTQVAWAVTYTHPQSMAPLCMPLHPAQLYSALLLFLIFLFQNLYVSRFANIQGVLMSSYLILAGAERFITDFFRADRLMISTPLMPDMFSFHQLIALGISITGCILLCVCCTYKKLRTYESV